MSIVHPSGITLVTKNDDSSGVTLQSGFISSGGELQKQLYEGVFAGFFNTVVATAKEWAPTIAHDTGRMETFTKLALSNALNGQKGNSIIKFDMVKAIESLGQYFKYHLEQSLDFNPLYRGGYKNPTTPGTKPMDVSDFQAIFNRKWKDELKAAFKTRGLAVS